MLYYGWLSAHVSFLEIFSTDGKLFEKDGCTNFYDMTASFSQNSGEECAPVVANIKTWSSFKFDNNARNSLVYFCVAKFIFLDETFQLIICIKLFHSLIEVYIPFTIKDRVDLLTAFAINSLWPNLGICYLCDPGKMTPMKMFRRKMPLEKAPPKKLFPQEIFQENFPREICPQVKFVLFNLFLRL